MNAVAEHDDRLTSRALAELIVDALFLGQIIDKESVEIAVRIAEEEIEVRKAVGDY